MYVCVREERQQRKDKELLQRRNVEHKNDQKRQAKEGEKGMKHENKKQIATFCIQFVSKSTLNGLFCLLMCVGICFLFCFVSSLYFILLFMCVLLEGEVVECVVFICFFFCRLYCERFSRVFLISCFYIFCSEYPCAKDWEFCG